MGTSRTLGGFSCPWPFPSTGSAPLLHGSPSGVSFEVSHSPLEVPLEAWFSFFDALFILLDNNASCSSFRFEMNVLSTAIDISLLLTWLKIDLSFIIEDFILLVHQNLSFTLFNNGVIIEIKRRRLLINLLHLFFPCFCLLNAPHLWVSCCILM
ncbi:hypothetical protein HanPSC8_Chr15g0683071 [Helianthus annuus]|nr:hypothetical protein HanPSC8_Chr15g0683071 [Helianthus annuus]